MDTTIVVAVLANVCALLVNVGAGFYWAGKIGATLAALNHRLLVVEKELARTRFPAAGPPLWKSD